MPIQACAACQGAVEVPAGGGRYACPHCGTVLGGAGTSVSASADTPPDGTRAIDPERHHARIRAAMSVFRGRFRRSGGGLDPGGLLAALGMLVGVPALFASPWFDPLILGCAGMGCCLVGLLMARDKLPAVLGIMVCAASAAGGIVLAPTVREVAETMGLVAPPAPPPEPDYGIGNIGGAPAPGDAKRAGD